MTLVSLILIPASYLYWKTGKKQLVWPMDLSEVFVPGSDTVRHPSQIHLGQRSQITGWQAWPRMKAQP